MPPALAAALVGAVALGACGGAVGLVVGLFAHPATAWFAVLEVGVPTAVAGSVLGLLAWVAAKRWGRPPAKRAAPE